MSESVISVFLLTTVVSLVVKVNEKCGGIRAPMSLEIQLVGSLDERTGGHALICSVLLMASLQLTALPLTFLSDSLSITIANFASHLISSFAYPTPKQLTLVVSIPKSKQHSC